MLVFKCVSPAWRCSGDTAEKTKGEVSQEDWLIEGSAAWRWWVPIWGRHRWDRRGWEREHRSSGGHLAWRDRWSLSFGDGGLIFSKWVLSTAHRGDHAVSELEVTKTNHNQSYDAFTGCQTHFTSRGHIQLNLIFSEPDQKNYCL